MGMIINIAQETGSLMRQSFVDYFSPLGIFKRGFNALVSFDSVHIINWFRYEFAKEAVELDFPAINEVSDSCFKNDIQKLKDASDFMCVFEEVLIIRQTNVVGTSTIFAVLSKEQNKILSRDKDNFKSHTEVLTSLKINSSNSKEDVIAALERCGLSEGTIEELVLLK